MAGDPAAGGAPLPAELTVLVFCAAGVAMGVEAAAVAEVLDAGAARRSGVAFQALGELLGAGGMPQPAKVLLFKGREEPYGVGVDELDELVVLPMTALQPLPEPLAHFRGPAMFWGVAVREDRIVLLVDADRLREPAAALEEARS